MTRASRSSVIVTIIDTLPLRAVERVVVVRLRIRRRRVILLKRERKWRIQILVLLVGEIDAKRAAGTVARVRVGICVVLRVIVARQREPDESSLFVLARDHHLAVPLGFADTFSLALSFAFETLELAPSVLFPCALLSVLRTLRRVRAVFSSLRLDAALWDGAGRG